MLLAERRKELEEKFEACIPLLGGCKEEVLEGIAECSKFPDYAEELTLVMKFLYVTMPLSDMGNYSFETFLDYGKHGVLLWNQGPFKEKIPEDIFLHYVLYHRVNNEEITPCRSFFYQETKEMFCQEDMKTASIDLNYWCAGEVTYQSTDDRTASPLAIYQKGHGRCGEESTFAVSVLRSAGVPARQVYAPKWSHCDDNHAWVEVWCEGEWFYLGACEPEEILNSGWFQTAASRAMMVHTRMFAREELLLPLESKISKRGAAYYENQLQRYSSEVCHVNIQVYTEESLPVSHARIYIQVVNYGELAEVAKVVTDERGCASVLLGKGSMVLTVHTEKTITERYFYLEKDQKIVLNINTKENQFLPEEFDMICPKEKQLHSTSLTAEEKERGSIRLEKAIEKRKLKKQVESPKDFRLVQDLLTEKDKGDVSESILEEHLTEALEYQDRYPKEIFLAAVLNPRIHIEHITAYRKFIQNYFSEEEKKEFQSQPQRIWDYIEKQIKEYPEWEYEELITSPSGCLTLKAGSSVSKRILFVAICRTLGIPARLNQMYLIPEFYEVETFRMMEGYEESGQICVLTDKEKWVYGQNWTLAFLNRDGEYETLNIQKEPEQGSILLSNMVPGRYRLLSANRLPSGNMLMKKEDFEIGAGEKKDIKLSMREAESKDMLVNMELPELILDKTAVKEDQISLIVWLDEGKEPTEHILNELVEHEENVRATGIQIIFMLEEESGMQDPTLKKALTALPEAIVCFVDFEEQVEKIARRMYLDPEKLPLIVLTDQKWNGIYGVSGYNVGTADMITKLAKLAK